MTLSLDLQLNALQAGCGDCMRQLVTMLILMLSSFSAVSSELSYFDGELYVVKNKLYPSIEDRHFAVYQLTLNLGVYGIDYLSERENGNGLFSELMKESWKEYILSSKQLRNFSGQRTASQQALAELYLIERTQSLYNKYMSNKSIRFMFKDQSLSLDNKIEDFLEETLSKSNKLKIPYLLKIVEMNKPVGYEGSVIFNGYMNKAPLDGFSSMKYHFSDVFEKLFFMTTNSISYSLGLVAGPVKWGRGGKLVDDVESKKIILGKLKPLDIILEKKAYKLTDYMIPGYWGHNAVWLGTKEQLLELGVWNSNELAPFRRQIELGNSVFEMRRRGVTFSRFDDWMNMDAFAAIRVKGMLEKSDADILRIFKILSEQIGKAYDFGFNADSAFKITCSELVYLAYGDYKWPTKNVFGRPTIGPNEIAASVFYIDSKLELVSFVTGDRENGAKFQSKDFLAKLMGFNAKEDGTFKKRYSECEWINEYRDKKRRYRKKRCFNKEKYMYFNQ